MKYHQIIKVKIGKTSGHLARFISYYDHPKFGKMLVIERRSKGGISDWSKPIWIMPSEVLEENPKVRKCTIQGQ